LKRFAVAVAAAFCVVVGSASPASAHTVTGVQATNFKSEILAVTPSRSDLHIRLLDFGRRVRLTYTGPGQVVVLGPQGEALEKVPSGKTVTWRDPRTRGEGTLRTTRNWTLTITTPQVPVVVTGRITWVPPPDGTAWFAAALVLLVVTASLGLLKSWPRVLSVAVAVLIASDAVHAFASAAPAADPLPLMLGKVLGAGFFTTLAWVIGAVAIGPLQRGREAGVLGAGLAGFILGMFSGIGDFGTLTHSQVPYSFPAVAARVAVSISFGVGFGLIVAAGLVLKRNPSIKPVVPATP
jgi:hypothetical protein